MYSRLVQPCSGGIFTSGLRGAFSLTQIERLLVVGELADCIALRNHAMETGPAQFLLLNYRWTQKGARACLSDGKYKTWFALEHLKEYCQDKSIINQILQVEVEDLIMLDTNVYTKMSESVVEPPAKRSRRAAVRRPALDDVPPPSLPPSHPAGGQTGPGFPVDTEQSRGLNHGFCPNIRCFLCIPRHFPLWFGMQNLNMFWFFLLSCHTRGSNNAIFALQVKFEKSASND